MSRPGQTPEAASGCTVAREGRPTRTGTRVWRSAANSRAAFAPAFRINGLPGLNSERRHRRSEKVSGRKQELAASALLALPTWAGTHPRSVGERDPKRGYDWVAASGVLTASGSVKTAGVHERLRRGLEWQVQNGAAAMDREDQCAPPPPWAAWPMLIDLNEATAGGLFDMTSHLVRQPYGSDERREFVKRWRRYEPDGCRVVAVASRPDIGVVPVRKLCGETGKQQ